MVVGCRLKLKHFEGTNLMIRWQLQALLLNSINLLELKASYDIGSLHGKVVEYACDDVPSVDVDRGHHHAGGLVTVLGVVRHGFQLAVDRKVHNLFVDIDHQQRDIFGRRPLAVEQASCGLEVVEAGALHDGLVVRNARRP